MSTPKKSRRSASFTREERAFIVSMVRAGVASSSGWLNEGQISHGMDLAQRLEALPLARRAELAAQVQKAE